MVTERSGYFYTKNKQTRLVDELLEQENGVFALPNEPILMFGSTSMVMSPIDS